MIYQNKDIDINNKIDILPMIDIIFSILAFLIISSLYLTRIDTIPVDLPKASNVVNQKDKFIKLSIRAGWVGIFLLILLWVVVRFIGPAAGWWIPADAR